MVKTSVKLSKESFDRLQSYMHDNDCKSYSEAIHQLFEEKETAETNTENQERENDILEKRIEHLQYIIDEMKGEI